MSYILFIYFGRLLYVNIMYLAIHFIYTFFSMNYLLLFLYPGTFLSDIGDPFMILEG